MSSVSRAISQRKAQRFIDKCNSYYATYAELKQCFDVGNARYLDSFVFFNDVQSLKDALVLYEQSPGRGQLFKDEVVTDLGKEIKVGLWGGESNLLTFTLIQRTATGNPASGGVPDVSDGNYGRYYILTDSRAAYSPDFEGLGGVYVARI